MIPLPSLERIAWYGALLYIALVSGVTGLQWGQAREAEAYAEYVNETRVGADYARELCGPTAERVFVAGERTLIASLATDARLTAEIDARAEWARVVSERRAP